MFWRRQHPFNRLLRPLSAREFVARYHRQRHVHLRGPARRFARVFSIETFERMIVCNNLPPAHVATAPAGTGLRASASVLASVDHRMAARLVEHVARDRAAITIRALDALDPGVARLARAVRECSGLETTANAYYTPPHADTLPWHWDNHDAFFFQLHGKKRWQLFRPSIERPLRHHAHTQWPEFRRETSRPLATLELAPGDVLYLPAGFPHVGHTGESDSLHITIGMHACAYSDVLRGLFERALLACEESIAFRKTPGRPADRAALQALAQQVFDRIDWTEADRIAAIRRMDPGRLDLDELADAWNAARDPRPLSLRSVLVRTPLQLAAKLTWRGVEVELEGEKDFILPRAMHEVLELVMTSKHVRVSDLPAANRGGKIALAHLLISWRILRKSSR